MIISVLPHSTGRSRPVRQYLLDTVGHAVAFEVAGDRLECLCRMIDALHRQGRKRTYTSLVVAFGSDRPTLSEILKVIDTVDRVLIGGMTRDRFLISWVLHRSSDGRIDLHCVMARQDLQSGLAYNPFPPGKRSIALRDAARDWANHNFGWIRPDDPGRRRTTRPVDRHITSIVDRLGDRSARMSSDDREKLKQALQAVAEQLVRDRAVMSRDELVVQLAERFDLAVVRRGREYVSVAAHGGRVRLQGELWSDRFRSVEALDPAVLARIDGDAPQPLPGVSDPALAEEALQRMEMLLDARRAWNLTRYGFDAVVPEEPIKTPEEILASMGDHDAAEDITRASDQQGADSLRAGQQEALGSPRDDLQRFEQPHLGDGEIVWRARQRAERARQRAGRTGSATGAADPHGRGSGGNDTNRERRFWEADQDAVRNVAELAKLIEQVKERKRQTVVVEDIDLGDEVLAGDGWSVPGRARLTRTVRGARRHQQDQLSTLPAINWWDLIQSLFADATDYPIGTPVRDGGAVLISLPGGEALRAEGDEISVEGAHDRVNDDTITLFVELVKRAKWPGVKLTGDMDWCYRATIALSSAGIPVTNEELQDLVAVCRYRDRSPIILPDAGMHSRPSRPQIATSAEEKAAAAAAFERMNEIYEMTVLNRASTITAPSAPSVSTAAKGQEVPSIPGASERDGNQPEWENPQHSTDLPRERRSRVAPAPVEPEPEDRPESHAEFIQRIRRASIVAARLPSDTVGPGARVRLEDAVRFGREMSGPPRRSSPQPQPSPQPRSRPNDER